MRLGFLSTSFPRFDGDVAGNFVHAMARFLVERGHSIRVLAPEPVERIPPPRWEGIELCWIPYARPRYFQQTFYGAGAPDNLRLRPSAWFGAASFIPALALAARRELADIDAIVSHWALPCGLVGTLLPNQHHVCVFHSGDLFALERLPGRARVARHLVHHVDRLVFVSPTLRDRFLACGSLSEPERQQLTVLPMGIDGLSTSDSRHDARARWNARRFTIVSLARLIPIKGIDRIIQAASMIGDCELLVAGDGPERRRLENRARALHAPVRFLGTVTGADKASLLRAGDVAVIASRRTPCGRTEGTPTAALEALAAGLPIVATAEAGLGWILDHRGGGLVVDGGADMIARAVTRLRDDAAHYQALSSRAIAVARGFHWDTIGPTWEAMLTKTIPTQI